MSMSDCLCAPRPVQLWQSHTMPFCLDPAYCTPYHCKAMLMQTLCRATPSHHSLISLWYLVSLSPLDELLLRERCHVSLCAPQRCVAHHVAHVVQPHGCERTERVSVRVEMGSDRTCPAHGYNDYRTYGGPTVTNFSIQAEVRSAARVVSRVARCSSRRFCALCHRPHSQAAPGARSPASLAAGVGPAAAPTAAAEGHPRTGW